MTTVYALLLNRCGLSHREAAALHRVRPDTVKSWSAGRNVAPRGVIEELRTLYARIEREAAVLVSEWDQPHLRPERDSMSLVVARDDAQAQARGLPCVGAQMAMLGIAAARGRLPAALANETARVDHAV